MVDLLISITAGITSAVILIIIFAVFFKTAKENGVDLDDEVDFPRPLH